MSTVADLPIAHTDPVNAKILAVSEDRIQGFVRDPIGIIAQSIFGKRSAISENTRSLNAVSPAWYAVPSAVV